MIMSIDSVSERLIDAGFKGSLEGFAEHVWTLLTIWPYDDHDFIYGIPFDECVKIADYIDQHYVPIGPEYRPPAPFPGRNHNF